MLEGIWMVGSKEGVQCGEVDTTYFFNVAFGCLGACEEVEISDVELA